MKKIALAVSILALSAGLAFAEETQKLDKAKKAMGFSPFKNELSMRFWPSETMGVDIIGGIKLATGDSTVFDLQVAGNLALPVFEDGLMSFNLLPGIRFGYNRESWNVTDTEFIDTEFIFAGTFGLEFEVLLKGLSEDVTIGSSVGVAAGMRSTTNSVDGDTETKTGFIAYLASDYAINPIYIRYYFK